MTDQEIQALIAQVQFPAPKDTEVVVNVPLTVPKAIFPDQAVAFAKSKGWSEANPMPALKFLADRIRLQVRSEFELFIRSQVAKQAKVQADNAIKGIFGN